MIYSDDRYRGYFHALEEADCSVCEIAGFRVDNRPAASSYSTYFPQSTRRIFRIFLCVRTTATRRIYSNTDISTI